jgi:exonuclease VII large subunit
MNRWLLVPSILLRILQTDANNMSNEDKEDEKRLSSALETFFKQALNHVQSLQSQPKSNPVSLLNLTRDLMNHFRQALKSVVIGFLGEHQLRQALLIDDSIMNSNNTGGGSGISIRLNLMRSLISTGDQIVNMMMKEGESSNTDDWRQLRETFLTMVDTQ